MKHATLVLIATFALSGNAHAQAWPNAMPSPYGPSTAVESPTVAAPATTATPSPTISNGVDLGAPPRALGGTTPNSDISNQAPPEVSSAPPVADLDNPESGRATAALNVLEAQGYASFSDFRPDGGAFTAMVSDGGQQFRVTINPDTGQISRE